VRVTNEKLKVKKEIRIEVRAQLQQAAAASKRASERTNAGRDFIFYVVVSLVE